MNGPAYSLWDCFAYIRCARGGRRDAGDSLFMIPSNVLVPPNWIRRALLRPKGQALFTGLAVGFPALLGMLAWWGFSQPDGIGPVIARLGANTLRDWFNRSTSLYAAVMLSLLLISVVGMPWDSIARSVRAVRHRRLWAYHAARHSRGPEDFTDILRQEHEQRVEVWLRVLHNARWRAALLFAWVDPFGRQLLVLALLTFTAWTPLAVQFNLLPQSGGIGLFGCGLPVLVPILGVVAIVRYRAAIRRLVRTLEHSRCPDCGYDLFDIPPALPKDKVPGAGPARCPECGSMWPLVPPPTDIDE